MTDTANVMAEVKTLTEQLGKTMNTMQAELAGVKRDAIDQAKFDKLNADLTAKLAEIDQKNAKLEAAMSRIGQGNPDEAKSAATKAKADFDAYLRKGAVPNGVSHREDTGLEVRAMSTNVNPDGGYLVIPALADFRVGREFETSPMRSVARVVQITGMSIQVLIDDNEVTSGWANEGFPNGETTTPQLGRKEIVAHKQEAEPVQTVEIIQDAAFDVEAWLLEKVRDKFTRTENTAFFSGSGVDKPKGFLSYANYASPGVYERDRLEQLITGAAATVTAEGLIRQQAALKESYQGRAVWMMNRATWGEVLTLKGADSFYFGEMLMPNGTTGRQILGNPVFFADDMQAVGASNLCVAYGDFSVGYTIVDRVGLSVLRDPYTSKGNIRFYATKRVGGDVTNFEAIKIARCSAS